jgi:cobaltochelatase CobN
MRKMKLKKKHLLGLVLAAFLIGVIAGAYVKLASPTRIAFVNYQAITLGQISKANNSSFIEIETLEADELGALTKYDMVFVNGMGLRITEEQRAQLEAAADGGVPVLTTSATNPQNLIVSVDSVDSEFLKQYMQGATRSNYRSLLHYVRKYIDGKKFFVEEPGDPTAASSGLLYHTHPEEKDGEELTFASVAEYQAFLRKHHLLKGNAPAVIVTGQMGVPDSLVARLEQTGNVVYPVRSIQNFIKNGHIDSLNVAAMVNMAHGRMGDEVVAYLTEHNIPLFAPLNVNTLYEEWMEDNQGMNGGFLSQSIVTPEIDGAIRPFALFAHYTGKDGLPYVAAIPDRLNEYVATINNYIGLQSKPNREKKVAIFYFKGPGQNALVAEGMEVAPSLYNLLCRLKQEGYNAGTLPTSAAELETQLQEKGKVFGAYAIGAQADFIAKTRPQLVGKKEYEGWMKQAMPSEMYKEICAVDGEYPGKGLHTAEGEVAIARVQFGNVVLIPQTAAGYGDDDFKVVHGTDAAPPHAYVASYLWARYGFRADALMHFGAHGSLEFTPRKQVALSSRDWSDRLVGTLPHFYVYSTSNVGEAMMAKRRSYAGILNYLTPPFMESNVRGIYKQLSDAVEAYNKLAGNEKVDASALNKASLEVKRHTVALGIHRELRMDSALNKPYTEEEIARIESFAEELANEKISGRLYTMGVPYEDSHIASTVEAMTADPIAYSLYALDRQRGKASDKLTKHPAQFTERYGRPAHTLVQRLLANGGTASDAQICSVAGITPAQLAEAREIMDAVNGSKDMFSRMMVMASSMPAPKPTAKIADRPETSGAKKHKMMPGMSMEMALAMAKKMGASEENLKKMEAAMKAGKKSAKKGGKSGHAAAMAAMGFKSADSYTAEQRNFATAVMEVSRAIENVNRYREALRTSPQAELSSIVNALNGGYIAPTSGGDPVLNPEILPTGRNMYAVNAEETPSIAAWERGKELAQGTIEMYRKAHHDSIPRKVSYTLWSSEFIETEGATIAQVLYMLGVEPVRDPFGRVTDLQLIPVKELGRPRIDVVVQTSGQLRDLAASRLFLIQRAVRMAAEAEDKGSENFVAQGVVETERHLIDKGVTPKEAREMSTARVFGGVNGNYGSGIQEMVEAGDRWEKDSEIADTYMANMGAFYGSEEDWEKLRDYAFEAALTNTEVVVQPRQSNTWGALSLDHVYEFMGGMNLAVRKVTGKDPEAYLSDYRNRNHVKMQEVKEAIGVESRTTVLNPTYVKEKMKGGSGDASAFADVVRNTYGWNVMKPNAIDNELWNDLYDMYVKDVHGLGTKEFFTSKNPAALEEITAVMMETARKGMWKASKEQLSTLAELHTEIVKEQGASCSGFVCNNTKLRDFIASNVSAATAQQYNQSIAQIRSEQMSSKDGMVMQKEELNAEQETTKSVVSGVIVAFIVLAAIVGLLVLLKRRRKNME